MDEASVAELVTEGVIHELEVVEVKEQQAERPSGSSSPDDAEKRCAERWPAS